ncbi:hypothetical protein CALVIDRAFT_533547 [Calocera viscosa TUFC12733]|uniref:Uncharacterized protein n=1 Tax=Calocera viscosa (strain TUFC12733) TaxID=1330018 RepID=A0A167R4H1_CALVF|nr:hypothetical protein CALVIDRAFT_533547 [Calocera viscosa TUFC12733]
MSSSTVLTTRPTAKLAQLRIVLDTLLRLLPGLPSLGLVGKVLKYAALLLLALNARSFPGMWHVRLWAHVWYWQAKRRLFRNDKRYMELMSPIGQSPFSALHIMRGLATLDDCDMFGHLSNSSYAKTLDIARFQTLMKYTVCFYAEKGVTALGGSDYAFFREIPIMSPYEMRTTIGGWDHKWIYLITYFITYPKKGTKEYKALKSSTPQIPPAPLPRDLLPSNALLNCVAVSRYCFKNRRLTVPPTIVLSLNGYGATSEIGWTRWHRKEQLRKEGKLKKVLAGAWNEEMERSSEEGGYGLPEFEEDRKKGMEICGKLWQGLDGLRAVAVQ